VDNIVFNLYATFNEMKKHFENLITTTTANRRRTIMKVALGDQKQKQHN